MVWEGVVHVFDLVGHPTATRAYAWSSPIEGSTKRRFFAVLHTTRINSIGRCASGNRGGASRNKVNLRRGFLRLGIGLVLLWLVFWNCAYVISPYNTSLKPEPAFVILVTEWRVLAPCLVASVVLGAWIAAGFRSN